MDSASDREKHRNLLYVAGAALIIIIIAAITLQNSIIVLNSSQIVLNNSGSTNVAGWKLIINPDGSGNLVSQSGHPINYGSKFYPAGTFPVSNLTAIIEQFGGASKIPTGNCVKSASFGSTTTLSYNGSTSGDVSCITGMTALSGELRLQLNLIESNLDVYS
jgi:hypothetical protein